MQNKIRYVMFFAFIIIGLVLTWLDWQNFLKYFDTAPEARDHTFEHAGAVGYAFFVASPLWIRKYFWSVVLIGLAAIFYAWVYFTAFSSHVPNGGATGRRVFPEARFNGLYRARTLQWVDPEWDMLGGRGRRFPTCAATSPQSHYIRSPLLSQYA